MDSDALTTIVDALAANEDLETRFGDGDEGNFLSGWQCDNPDASAIIEKTRKLADEIDYIKYYYMESDGDVIESISSFHANVDGVAPKCILPSACGSTSLLFTFCAHLIRTGVREIYYISPIYFTVHFALKLFGIEVRPVNGAHPYESEFSINLPEKQTTLIFTDPVWFAGKAIPDAIVNEIYSWQIRTQSTVFVDGSFQYMRWNGVRAESTAALDAEKTFRLICPTKILGVHGYRFSYLIMPPELRGQFTNTFTNIYASSSAINKAFALVAMNEMVSGRLTGTIVRRSKERFNYIINNEYISTATPPECGYFCFANIGRGLSHDYKLMTQEFFEQRRFPGYAKINLISPSFHMLAPDCT